VSIKQTGARLVLLCRNTEKAHLSMESIIAENATAEISIQHIDLSSLTSVRICASEILQCESRVDALIHCASVAYLPTLTKSTDGHEFHLAVNYLGPFLLTQLLAERMKQTAREFDSVTKVIQLNSCLHRIGKIHLQDLHLDKAYSPVRAYAQSRLAAILASRELARQHKADRVHFYSLDPGFTRTNSAHYAYFPLVAGYCIHLLRFIFGQNCRTAADKVVRLLVQAECAHETGYYYQGGIGMTPRIVNPAKQAMDDKMVKSLWAETLKLCNIEL